MRSLLRFCSPAALYRRKFSSRWHCVLGSRCGCGCRSGGRSGCSQVRAASSPANRHATGPPRRSRRSPGGRLKSRLHHDPEDRQGDLEGSTCSWKPDSLLPALAGESPPPGRPGPRLPHSRFRNSHSSGPHRPKK